MRLRSLPAFSAAALTLAAPLFAQTHQVAAPQKVTRAVGVYEWTGDLSKPTAARLVPVSLFLEGHFEDAGVYLARPVPFALMSGNVYTVETAGEPKGTLNLATASNIVSQNAIADGNPLGAWYGYGKFVPPPPEAPAPKLRASKTPGVIVSSKDDSKPPFSDKSASGQDTAATAGKPAPKADVDTDPDRPHMTRRTETTDSGNVPDDTRKDPNDRPTLQRHDPKAEKAENKRRGRNNDSGVIAPEKSLNDDPDRPTLHRGAKPEDQGVPPLTGLPRDMRQAIAVSDAAVNEAHPFTREWDSAAERGETLVAMQTLARKQVVEYLATNRLVAVRELPPEPLSAPAPSANAIQNPTESGATRDPNAPTLQRGVPKAYTEPAAPAVPPLAGHRKATAASVCPRPSRQPSRLL